MKILQKVLMTFFSLFSFFPTQQHLYFELKIGKKYIKMEQNKKMKSTKVKYSIRTLFYVFLEEKESVAQVEFA